MTNQILTMEEELKKYLLNSLNVKKIWVIDHRYARGLGISGLLVVLRFSASPKAYKRILFPEIVNIVQDAVQRGPILFVHETQVPDSGDHEIIIAERPLTELDKKPLRVDTFGTSHIKEDSIDWITAVTT